MKPAHLVQVDSTVIDLPKGIALLNLLQHFTIVGLIDNCVALWVNRPQVDLAGRVVLAASVVQDIAVTHLRVPVQQLCICMQIVSSDTYDKAKAAGGLSAQLASEGLVDQGSKRYLREQGLYNATGMLSTLLAGEIENGQLFHCK